MKKTLKKILIIITAVACSCCIHISAGALGGSLFPDTDLNDIQQIIDQFLNPTTTTDPADNTTTSGDNNNNAEPDNGTQQDPVNSSGTGSITTTTEQPATVPPTNNGNNNNNYYNNNNYIPSSVTTTEPQEESFSYESSLGALLEDDSANIIVQTPEEPFTIGNIVVNNGDKDSGFEWQKIALIAAAVLFIILAALIVALLIQRNKKAKEDAAKEVVLTHEDEGEQTGPVTVEVMTPERIAELLGKASGGAADELSATAFRNAALMGQLTHSYSDPLIRKYTEEPVKISPIAAMNADGDVTGAEILEATDSMLDDITGNEKYASDTSGMEVPETDIESLMEDTEVKTCPECGAPVKSGDMFCHSCGSFVG